MGSPTIFSGLRTKLLTANGFLLQSGETIDYDGLINYITNGHAEIDTTGWATYSNTAANIPSTGTGGTATGLTFSRSTSSPLDQAASFTMVQANSTSLQGKGVSYDFTINSADQAHVLNILFDFNASSTFVASNGITPPLNDGTTTTNAGNSDIEVFMYDKTNSQLIYCTPQVIAANGTNNFKFASTFQTNSNSTSYRLIFHVATTSANATGWTLKFDNVFVGRQPVSLGAPVTDWTSNLSLTLSASFGTTTNATYETRRVGDSLQVVVSYTAGTVTGSQANVTLPSGLTIDSTKLPSNSGGTVVGTTSFTQSGATNIYSSSAVVFYDGSDTAKLYFANSTASSVYTKANANSVSNNNLPVTFAFTVPIVGWSSSTQMSNTASTRVVAASVARVGAYTATSNTAVAYDTILLDTHGAFSTSTGLYTCPVSGDYRVTTSHQLGASPSNIKIAKNGASYTQVVDITSSGNNFAGSASIPCVAGDTLAIWLGTGRAFNVGSAPYLCTAAFELVQGPSQLAVVDAVNARYFASATSVSGSLATVSWTTKDYDSASGMSAGTYTAPTSGKYQVNSSILVSGTIALNSTLIMEIQKNGTVVSRYTEYAGGIETNMKGIITDQISCVAGDTLRIQVSTSITGPSIVSSNFDNYISLFRTGN